MLRLADVQLLHDLKRRAERLWPELPERIAAMREWLADADRLSRNLEQHRRTLSELRAAAKPYDAATRASDRESFAHAETLALRERERQRLLQGFEPANAEPLSPTVRYQRLLELDREIETLERELDDRRRWVFADTETQWRHDTVAELVAGLADLPVLVSQVRDRLRRAECVAQDTTEAYAAEWEEATASIEDEGACPAYHGLQLEPQLGLVPIGRDRRSGLWEFALPRSGEIPARDGEGTLHIDESSALVFVLLPGGDFTMGAPGATPDGENYDRWSQREESPPHRVHLAPFFLAKYEMTQGQWLNVTGYNPSFYNAQADPVRHSLLDPVENVSYEECRSVLAHLGLVLPTEAQWEYGARGGTATIWWTGDDVRSCRGAANLADQSLQRVRTDVMDIESWLDDGYSDLAPVGQHQENGFGLHDTIGNVSEWCQDWYGVDGYRDPVRPGDGLREVSAQLSWRVSRGGSFYNSGRLARSSFRFHDVPEHRDCATGVRPARVITSP
ncbi:MAG: formylglycine-generating enzyme family protein [Planctomycetota bacterium]